MTNKAHKDKQDREENEQQMRAAKKMNDQKRTQNSHLQIKTKKEM